MKYLIILLLAIPTISLAQKIERNEVDEFTKAKIIETKWEPLVYGGDKCTIHYKIRLVNNLYILDIKFMKTDWFSSTIYSIGHNDNFMLLMSDSSVVDLKPIDGTVCCKGCGAVGFLSSNAYGTQTSYHLSPEDVEKLLEFDVTKTRMYTSKGYINQTIPYESRKKIHYTLKMVLGA